MPGVLIECDPSIKSIIVNINSEKNEYIIEDLVSRGWWKWSRLAGKLTDHQDDTHLVIIEERVPELKRRLDEVSRLWSRGKRQVLGASLAKESTVEAINLDSKPARTEVAIHFVSFVQNLPITSLH